jgi:tetratricopeptide (TPR) repeat protein/predicted aspartyl protease
MRRIVLALLAALTASGPADAACQVGKMLELKVTMQGSRPLADVGINGRTIPFIVDSGAFYSDISPGVAAELGLQLVPSPIQLGGIGGPAGSTYLANVKSLDLAGIPIKNVQFIVGGSETGVGGLLGQNVLGMRDVEYDLEHGVIRIMRASGCSSKNNLAYWSGDKPVSELSVDPIGPSRRHTIGTIFINGAKVRAIFDTGAGSSLLSLEAAKRAGLRPASPGVIPAGRTRGLGRSMVQTWLAPVASVKIGTEEVRNIKVRMADINLPEADMLIGADFFLSHRVYVSNSLGKMYFTYDGGPVFNMTPSRVVDDTGAAETIAADKGPEPTDAAGFGRRGAAETSRRDYVAAVADLDRAVAMEPNNGRYLLERARAKLLMGERPAAFADLDKAAEVAPADAQIRLAHAESLIGRRRPADAQKDLEAVDAALPRQDNDRLTLAALFQRLDRFDSAIADYDQWIAAHPDDSRQPIALNGRCWSRALAGRDLPLALKDCDAALRRMKSANFYDSRGLVELRMGQYDRAIADYDAALQLAPRTAWSLYGRGLARRHKGDSAAQADIDAAVAIDPALPARARTLGIS